MKHFDFCRLEARYVNLTVFDNNDQLFKYQDKKCKTRFAVINAKNIPSLTWLFKK